MIYQITIMDNCEDNLQLLYNRNSDIYINTKNITTINGFSMTNKTDYHSDVQILGIEINGIKYPITYINRNHYDNEEQYVKDMNKNGRYIENIIEEITEVMQLENL